MAAYLQKSRKLWSVIFLDIDGIIKCFCVKKAESGRIHD